MCFGGSKPAAQAAPAPPPPPPVDSPASPVFNEASTTASNDSSGVSVKRKGTRAMRIDLQTPGTTVSSAASATGSGLAVPR